VLLCAKSMLHRTIYSFIISPFFMCNLNDPGCSGAGSSGKDYCYDRTRYTPPTGPNALTYIGEQKNLARCQGDCDRDGDCLPGLLCYERCGVEPVPGCDGLGVEKKDYCYSPQPTTDPPTLSPGPNGETYYPGLLTVHENGLLLSKGLTSRIIATAGKKVALANGEQSVDQFHLYPDYGHAFADPDPNNPGGWIYMSNSEMGSAQGGVGALKFDSKGDVIDYRMLLRGTNRNCGGGPTPWGSYITCEETTGGRNWQVDPSGIRTSGVISLGNDGIGGSFESFAYDLSAPDAPQFFVTEDATRGALQRWRPTNPDWNDPWNILHGPGTTDYLVLEPDTGTFYFTPDRALAEANAADLYPNSEGIDSVGGMLYFVSKAMKGLYILDLHNGTYTSHTTSNGAFDGQPDQVKRLLPSVDLLYFTEDGTAKPGIHGRNQNGAYFTIMEGYDPTDESTGLAMSPDAMHLYFALQRAGHVYDVTRSDGMPFSASTLNIKYHGATEATLRRRLRLAL